MNGFEKFDESQLLEKENFYSSLRDERVSDKDYEHAEQIWRELEIKTMRDYHDLYLKTDVLLLADVFEGFRNIYL